MGIFSSSCWKPERRDLFISPLSLSCVRCWFDNGTERWRISVWSKRTFFVGKPGRCMESRGGASWGKGRMDRWREAQLGAGLWRAPLAGSAARAAPVAGPPAAPAEAAPEPAERSGAGSSRCHGNYWAREGTGIETGALVAAGKDGRSGGGRRQAAAARQAPRKPRHANPLLRRLPLERSKLSSLPSWRILILTTPRYLIVKIRLLRIHRLSKTSVNHPTPVLEETDRRWGKRWGRAGVKCSSPAKSPAPACYNKKRIMWGSFERQCSDLSKQLH